MKTHLITGGAGFVGVNLARRLLEGGDSVVAVDDLSRGKLSAVEIFSPSDRFTFVKVDCSDAKAFIDAVAGLDCRIDAIWHLAANSDIPAGIADYRIDLQQTFMTTIGALEVARTFDVARFHFASSSAIYGDHGDTAIHENIGPLEPISSYGAMKLASEAQIRAAVEAYLPRAEIFRFPNVIGTPATHGVIWDFVRKLKDTPGVLEVLGDGTQQKSYLHVDDLVDAMLHIGTLEGRFLVFNIGPRDNGITVRSIAEAVRDIAAPEAAIQFGTGNRGWVGDIPRFRYSIDKLAASGWTPKFGSEAAMLRSVKEITLQEMGG